MTGNTVEEPVYIWWSPDGVNMVPVTAANPFPVSLQGSGGSSAVTIADGSDVAEGAKANAAATDSTSSWSVVALLKGLLAQQLSTNPLQVFSGDNYARITTNATTVVKNIPGSIIALVVNSTGTTETVTIYDNTAASGTNPFTFVLTGLAVGTRITMNAKFGTGITVVTSGGAACDITVLYQ